MNHYIYSLMLIFACYQLSSAANDTLPRPVDSTVFDCRTAQPPAVNCRTDPNCLYPNPQNCSRFFQCDETYQAYLFECAYSVPPLVFNTNIRRCDWPDNFQCAVEDSPPVEPTTEEETEPPTTEQPEEAPEQPETTTAPPEAPETTRPPEQPQTTSAPPVETTTPTPGSSSAAPPPEAPPSVDPCRTPEAQSNLSAGCPAPRNCMFPNKTNCQGFVQCQANGDNPITNPMPCPLGNDGELLYWNDNTVTCERYDNSTCPNRPQPPPEANPTEPPTTTEQPEEAPEQPETTTAPPEEPTTTPPAEEAPETTGPPEQPETTTQEGSSSTALPKTPPCQTPEAQSNLTAGCPGPRYCQFPDPDDCQGYTYIQCQASCGAPIQFNRSCPESTYWNDNSLKCENRENNSTCGSQPPEANPTPETTTEPPENAPEEPETTTAPSEAPEPETTTTEEPADETVTETTTPPTTTTTEPPEEAPAPTNQTCRTPEAQSNLSAGCPAPRNCMFPNPNTCQGFIQCVAGGPAENYEPIAYEMPCAYGHNGQLYWNDNTVTCEEQNNSTCPNRPPALLFEARKRRSVMFGGKLRNVRSL